MAQPKVQDGSGGPPGGQVGVQMPPQRSGWGREAHPKIREGWETYPVVQEWSRGPRGGLDGLGGPPEGLRRVGTGNQWAGRLWSLSQRSWMGRDAHLECRERSEAL